MCLTEEELQYDAKIMKRCPAANVFKYPTQEEAAKVCKCGYHK